MYKLFDFIKSLYLYLKGIKRSAKLTFFQYEEFAKDVFEPPMYYISQTLYGNYRAVSFFTKKRFNFIRDYVEHGVCFLDTVDSVRMLGNFDRIGMKNIYTYSTFRKSLIEQYIKENNIKGKHVYCLGPFILGVDGFYTREKLSLIKQQYGKILLVYPIHYIVANRLSFDIDDFISEIEKHRNDFQSVFICLHWRHILDEKEVIDKYKSMGYVVVCNGNPADPLFLSRQKDLITLSDMMLTNGLGTHIGYFICMNKPVCFYSQTIISESKSSKDGSNNFFDDNVARFQKAFSNYSFDITDEQVSLVKKYWGEW